MEKIKEYKGIIILILVVLGGAFYWYEWRPSQIREACANPSASIDPIFVIYKIDGVSYYDQCLRNKGLEK